MCAIKRILSLTISRLKQTEDDLSNSERTITSQKRKLDALLQSINSPSGVNASLRQRLIAESPAPQLSTPEPPPGKRSRLAADSGTDDGVELDMTIDLFPDLESQVDKTSAKSPSVLVKKQCQDYGTKFVKITSAANKNVPMQSKRELSEIGNVVPPGYNFSIMKKKAGMHQQSSIVKQGYNGLGTHEKCVMPFGRNRAGHGTKKPGARPSLLKKGPPPQLPSLNNFLSPS